MRKTVIDIQEMSDSKELYGSRPNPFVPAFIYCLLLLLLAAAAYSCFGKIEIVTRSSGVVRPNDDVSTVSSLVSGRITAVNYSDGQLVHAGEPLFSVDMSELQIRINSLEASREKLLEQKQMLEKFLDGIEAGENPFSDNAKSKEYPYYVQFQDYLLALKNTQQTIDFDVNKNGSSIQSLNEQIAALQYQLNGWYAYRDSIYQGANVAGDYPEYANMYELYAETMAALYNDYVVQFNKILHDADSDSSAYYLSIYQEQLADYNKLIELIEADAAEYPAPKEGTAWLLFEEYRKNLDEYTRQYQAAKETYEYYLNGGAVGENEEALLAYSKTMLEGYQYYLQSVLDKQDRFDDTRDSAFYRSLYTEYSGQYQSLEDNLTTAQRLYDEQSAALAGLRESVSQYETLAQDPGASEDVKAEYARLKEELKAAEAALSGYAEAISAAQTELESFQTNTILAIRNTITRLEAEIAEKEVSLGGPSADYNTSAAKTKMESAQSALESYKNSALLEYRQRKIELESKIHELNTAISAVDVNQTLDTLNESFESSVAQKQMQTISQIDNSIQSLQNQIISARSSVRGYQVAAGMYENNVDENGDPLPIAMAVVEQTTATVNGIESMETQLRELDSQLDQLQMQRDQGTILAEQSGVVNVTTALVPGDVIASGNVIATIIPVNESELKAQIYVSSADMGNMKIGDEIRYNIPALPSSQYGTVSGKVLSVSQDALVQNGQFSGYFLVEGSLECAELVDRDGNVGKITIGMQIEARIVTQRKTIIRYLLEKINLD
ncbi:MAG: HlyD family efflux transporter periplasmic adaptor subunit [Oscillospiraceae bacterium]|nr:HlyD family efflux transporter periplasmic adaptor subunit [Oscillospiraceae bacterium]